MEFFGKGEVKVEQLLSGMILSVRGVGVLVGAVETVCSCVNAERDFLAG